MEINVKQIKISYESLKAEYESLENIELNLFLSLSNIHKFDWIDGNSMDFAKELDKEKLDTDTFQMYVFSLIEIFNYIHGLYESLGYKVKCNLDKKNVVIYSINKNISLVESILNEYNRTDLDFPYGEFGSLRSCKRTYKEIKKKLIDMKEYYNSLFSKIEKLESYIEKKIKEIEEFIPRKFLFMLFGSKDLYNIEKPHLSYNEFALDLGKIDLYKKNEKEINEKIYKKMNNIKASYVSKNNDKYLNKVEEFKKDYLALLSKRNEYITTLNKVPPLYDQAAIESIRIFEEEE